MSVSRRRKAARRLAVSAYSGFRIDRALRAVARARFLREQVAWRLTCRQ